MASEQQYLNVFNLQYQAMKANTDVEEKAAKAVSHVAAYLPSEKGSEKEEDMEAFQEKIKELSGFFSKIKSDTVVITNDSDAHPLPEFYALLITPKELRLVDKHKDFKHTYQIRFKEKQFLYDSKPGEQPFYDILVQKLKHIESDLRDQKAKMFVKKHQLA